MARARTRQRCYLCGAGSPAELPGRVRDNARLKVLECRKCGLVFLSSFSHINSGFYEESGMHGGLPDVARWLAETERDDERRFRFCAPLLKGRAVLDFGCGNAGFLLKAKKTAASALGLEPEKALAAHYKKLGLRVEREISGLREKFDLVTLFHVLEHIPEPAETLKSLKPLLRSDGRVLVEVPNSADALLRLYKSEPFSRFTYWSCHLYLFNAATLRKVARKAGYSVAYVKHVQRYPLSNHLYWLACGRPGGHEKWAFLDSPELNEAYAERLAAAGATDTIMACLKPLRRTGRRTK